jgi:hypothetical protein
MVTAIVVASHCIVQIIFYRGRVVNGWLADDLIIFGLPSLVAFVVYAVVLRYLARTQLVGTFLGAFGITFLSFLTGLFVSLNTYGS